MSYPKTTIHVLEKKKKSLKTLRMLIIVHYITFLLFWKFGHSKKGAEPVYTANFRKPNSQFNIQNQFSSQIIIKSLFDASCIILSKSEKKVFYYRHFFKCAECDTFSNILSKFSMLLLKKTIYSLKKLRKKKSYQKLTSRTVTDLID